MSGPSVSILLSQPFLPYEAELIAQTIVALCGEPAAWEEMHVIDTAKIGGTFVARQREESRPFGMSASAWSVDEIDAAGALFRHFDIWPTSQIDLYAFCNARVDHQILGEIALHLVTHMPASLISFGGDLSPYASVGGELVSVAYETESGTYAVSSYGDSHFLRAWLRHPSFFMVK